VLSPEETIFKIISPFETLSPTLTSTFSTLPLIVEGISTLDLSLSIVITGSLIFNWSPSFAKTSMTSLSRLYLQL